VFRSRFIYWGFLLLVAGCTQGLAPQNPLLSSLSQTPVVSCPSQFNFETPGSDAVWNAPNWALGNVSVSPTRVSSEAACGNWSLMEKINVSSTGTANNYALLYTVLPQAANFDGRTLSVWVMFDPPPPASLEFTLQFIDHSDNWVPTAGNPAMVGLKPGWNLLSKQFYGSQVDDIMALNFTIQTSDSYNGANGVSYAGTMWIDEVNW
jgi:hypothetical protein